MSKKKSNEITLEMCESQNDLDLLNHAKTYVDRANELIDAGNLCIGNGNRIIKGKFCADSIGMMGVGFRHSDSAAYTHLFGRDVTKMVDKKKVKVLSMPYTKESIDKSFKDLRFVNPTHFVSL